MREVKFRVFGYEHNEMLDWEHIIESGALAEYLSLSGEGDNYHSPIMQYTGIKDKNNKEIYEGDIVRIPQWNRNYEVIFESGMFKVDGNSRFSLSTTQGELSCEVIGNIYENVGLLNSRASK